MLKFDFIAEENRDMLKKVGFFDSCGKEWLFPSVQDAVNHSLLLSKLVSIIYKNNKVTIVFSILAVVMNKQRVMKYRTINQMLLLQSCELHFQLIY